MAVSCGILGLPNVGKTTLFNAMTQTTQGAAEAYPFTTIDPNRGRVLLEDERLEVIASIMKPENQICADFPVVDIAGLVRGASRGEGLGNQFLAHVREMDMLIHVVRCFFASHVPHVEGTISPVRDVEIIDTELCMADLEVIERRRQRLAQEAKGKTRAARANEREGEMLDRFEAWLDTGTPLRRQDLSAEEEQLARALAMVSAKPVLYAANLDEGDLLEPSDNEHYASLLEHVRPQASEVVPVSAQICSELAVLTQEERDMFMEELGLSREVLAELSQAVYRTLSLITYFTVNEKEVRARSLRAGASALEAAGQIHTDMARGFIRAEVISTDQLAEAQSMTVAREKGWVRLEGKDYRVQDGDILYIRFNV